MCYLALSHALLITFEWVEYSYHKITKIFSINILLNLIWVYWSFGNKKTVFWFNKKKSFSMSLEWSSTLSEIRPFRKRSSPLVTLRQQIILSLFSGGNFNRLGE